MTSTITYRTQASATLTVSTALVRDGAVRFYETTIIVSKANGAREVLDGIRTTKKADAGIEHDAAVAWARGYTDKFSKRHAYWAEAVRVAKEVTS